MMSPPPEDPTPAERVVNAVSERTGTDPIELPVLYDHVDPEALNDWVDQLDEGTVSFQYAGFQVTVDQDASVSLTDTSPSGGKQPAAGD